MDAVAALFQQEDKENIPPPHLPTSGSNCTPDLPPTKKKFFRRRQRIPLADITNLFRTSDSAGQRSVSDLSVMGFGSERVSGRKRKSSEDDDGDDDGDDMTSFGGGNREGSVSRSLRFGFR